MLPPDDLYAFGRGRSVCDNSIWLLWLDLKDLAVEKSAFASERQDFSLISRISDNDLPTDLGPSFEST